MADVGHVNTPGLQLANHFGSNFFPSSIEPKNPTGYRFGVGRQLTPYLGFEAAYVHLGATELTAASVGCDETANHQVVCGYGRAFQRSSVSPQGLTTAAVGSWPISDRLSLFVQIGAIAAHTVSTLDTKGEFSEVIYRASSNSVRPLYGIGTRWSFLPNWGLHLTWTRFKDLSYSTEFNSSFIDSSAMIPARSFNADVLALGIMYSF